MTPRPTPEQRLRAEVRAVAALGTDARETLAALILRCGGGAKGLEVVERALEALRLEVLP